MKYIKIQNKGILPLKLLTLIGASTKTNDLSKIGEFGTGLKYAIAYFVRHQINIKLFIGIHEIAITTRENKIGNDIYCEIVLNKKATGITTQYGFQWKAWEAIREVWCNALDEKNAIRELVIEGVEGQKEPICGVRGHTTFYIEVTDSIKEVLDNWNNHFLQNEVALFENDDIAIYHNNGKALKLYKNGVLTHTSEWYKSIFKYDIKKSHLNELREYKGFMHGDIASALLKSNKFVGKILLNHFKPLDNNNDEDKRKGLFEISLDYSYASDTQPLKFKEIFEGYVFLHPDSSIKAISEKAVRVSDTLFKVLKTWVPTEDIKYSGGGGYYGGGGYTSDNSPYKLINNAQLIKRLERLFEKHNMSKIKFNIAVPIKETFDFLINDRTYIINTDLEVLNDKDLEVIVLIILIDFRDDLHFKVLKRLLKANLSNKNLHKMLFEL